MGEPQDLENRRTGSSGVFGVHSGKGGEKYGVLSRGSPESAPALIIREERQLQTYK